MADPHSRAWDLIVIGGGVIGLASAFRLAGDGQRVCLLEATRIGDGSTGASLGALMPHTPLKETPLTDIQRDSLAAMPDFVAAVEAASGLPCHYRRAGRLEILPSAEAAERCWERIDAARTRWAALGDIPLRWLDESDARQLMPWLASAPYGVLHDDVTAQIDPASLLASLSAACRARGVEIREGTLVQSLEPGAQDVSVVTKADKLTAAQVVVANGIAATALLPDAKAVPAVRGIKGEAMRIPHPARTEWPLVYAHGSFALSRSDGFYIGSTSDATAPLDTTVTRGGFKDLTARRRKLLALDETALRPSLWSGFRPATADRQPCVGPLPDSNRIILAAGHFKIGLGLAPATADAVAAMTTGRDPGPAWANLSPARWRETK